MKFNQHTELEVLIPQHISMFCVATAHAILLNSIITYIYGYYLLSICEFGLYISSVIFWSKVRHNGIEKNIDICLVIINCCYGTYISFTLPIYYNIFWLCTISFCCLTFIMNEYIFYYQVRIHYNKYIPTKTDEITKYNWFSLDYTNPHTHNREMAYYRSTITHGTILHIITSISSIYCITHSK